MNFDDFDFFEKTGIRIKHSFITASFLSIPRGKQRKEGQCVDQSGASRVDTALDLKVSPKEHLLNYLKRIGDPEGSTPRTILIVTVRNSGHQLLQLAWSAEEGLYALPDEPLDTSVYDVWAGKCNGKLGLFRAQIDKDGQLHPLDGITEQYDWAVAGIGLTRDGRLEDALLPGKCADERHLYRVLWEQWQRELFPGHERDLQIHHELNQAFKVNLNADIKDRAAAVSRVAAEHHLTQPRRYLHSCVYQADVYWGFAAMTAPLPNIGREFLRFGASGLVLDNGGSVGWSYFSRKAWGESLREKGVLPPPVVVGNNLYHRPEGHAAVVLELAADPVDEPFRPESFENFCW